MTAEVSKKRPPRSGRPERRLGSRKRESMHAGWRPALIFLGPWILACGVLTAWPVLYTGYLSLTDYEVINDPQFLGFVIFQKLMEDEKLRTALWNTFYFTIIQVPLLILLALALALLLNRAGRASGFFRTAFFLPKMTPPVAVGIMLLLLFNGQNGLINKVLGVFGISGPAWTTDPSWVKPGLILMSLWTVGSSVIILLAALRNVPNEMYESARVDGANFMQQTTRITIPMISGTIFFLVIVNTIAGFQTFTEAYTAFFGAGNSTYSNDSALFYVIYLFQQAFEYFEMGYASAMAWLLFVVIMIVTVIQLRVSRRFVYYESEEA